MRAIVNRPETLGGDELELHLIAAPEDGPSWEHEYQFELFYLNHRLDVGGVEYAFLVEGPGCKGPVEAAALGEWFIRLTAAAGPVIGTVVGAWLHARYGRKVRLKIGDIEAEAQSMAEVEQLLARAQEIQQRNQPPKIIPG